MTIARGEQLVVMAVSLLLKSKYIVSVAFWIHDPQFVFFLRAHPHLSWPEANLNRAPLDGKNALSRRNVGSMGYGR